MTLRAAYVTSEKHLALRPAGFTPLLDGAAARDRALVNSLLDAWTAAGFHQVSPIQVDDAETLLDGQSWSAQNRAFRFIDPIDGGMLALLPDVTLGIARLAAGELAQAPRPLHLSYEGQAIRTTGSARRPARQFGQVGLEVMGATLETPRALISLALKALFDLGLDVIHLALVLPPLASQMIDDLNLPRELAQALDRKDEAKIATLAGPQSERFLSILAGDFAGEPRLQVLSRLKAQLSHEFPQVHIRCDPFEQSGFAFQSGPSFSLYSPNHQGDLGRGGWYGSAGEDCFGFTLYRDALLRLTA